MKTQCTVCRYSAPDTASELCALLPDTRLTILDTLPPDRRKQGILAEGILRLQLSYLMGLPPREVPIHREAGTKPFCPGFPFSLSHTAGAVAVLLSDSEAGVDIERLRSVRLRAGRACFTEQEYRLAETDEAHFWAIWTQKEALVKSLGIGLNREMQELNALSLPHSRLLHTKHWQDFALSVCARSAPEFIYIAEEQFLACLRDGDKAQSLQALLR